MGDSLARYSYATIRTEDWSITEFTGRDGIQYKVDGYVWDDDLKAWRCPTEKCGALCCKNINLKGQMGKRCQLLADDLLCDLHRIGGPATKPVSCWIWPRNQESIDILNERFADGDVRCYLKLVPLEG